MSESPRTPLPFLASLEGRRDPESRRVLLRVATDRFVNDPAPSRETIAQFEREVLPLVADCDPATRLIVARKIAPRLVTPPAVLETIIERGSEAALVILERGAAIGRETLIAAASGEPAAACAVAKRTDLDEEMVDLIVAGAAPQAVLALARNPAATLSTEIFADLAQRARRDRVLAEALLARPAAPMDRAALFLHASSSQRSAMLLAAQRAELARASAPFVWRAPDGAAARLERHALTRQPALFVAALANALGCEGDLAERIVAEPSGEPLAVALAALETPEDAMMRILLLGDAVSLDYKRLGALTRLKNALHPAAARRIVAAMVGSTREKGAKAEPVLDPVAAPTPSRAAPSRHGLAATETPHVQRRRRAFQLAAAGGALRDG